MVDLSLETLIQPAVLYGGTSRKDQSSMLARGCDILVGTPGRVRDILGGSYIEGVKALSFEDLSHMVLDEADELLSKDFAKEIALCHVRSRAGESTQRILIDFRSWSRTSGRMIAKASTAKFAAERRQAEKGIHSVVQYGKRSYHYVYNTYRYVRAARIYQKRMSQQNRKDDILRLCTSPRWLHQWFFSSQYQPEHIEKAKSLMADDYLDVDFDLPEENAATRYCLVKQKFVEAGEDMSERFESLKTILRIGIHYYGGCSIRD